MLPEAAKPRPNIASCTLRDAPMCNQVLVMLPLCH